MRFSLFSRKPNPRKDRLYQIALSGASEEITATRNETPSGLVIRVPVILVMGEQTRRAEVRHFISDDRLVAMAELAGVIEEEKAVPFAGDFEVTTDPAASRAKYCKNKHRLISENVIHWPNGQEDCRVCYMEYKVRRGSQK